MLVGVDSLEEGQQAQRQCKPSVILAVFLFCALASFSKAAATSPVPSHAEALSPEDKLSTSTAPSLSSQPELGSWGACSALQLARQDFQAVVLRNGSLEGKVLAVGGCCNGASSLASSELFSPEDDSWHTSGDLSSARWLFQAVALPNGSALAIGGLSIAKGGVLNSTEIFIPAKDNGLQGSWSEVAAMNTPRQDFGAVLLDDGTVLAVGGFMASTEIYDPAKDLWTQTSSMSMHDARSAFEMVKLSSGKVLAVGGRGRGSGGVLTSAELFDPATKTWQTQGSMADGRASFAAVAMSDGRVLAAGGMSGNGMMLNSSEIFDPETGTWSEGPDMNYHRALQQAIALPSGRLLMVGGLGGLGDLDTSILDTAEVFDPTTNEWELTDAMVSGRYVFQLVNLPNGTAMAIGGTGLKGFTSSTELFATS